MWRAPADQSLYVDRRRCPNAAAGLRPARCVGRGEFYAAPAPRHAPSAPAAHRLDHDAATGRGLRREESLGLGERNAARRRRPAPERRSARRAGGPRPCRRQGRCSGVGPTKSRPASAQARAKPALRQKTVAGVDGVAAGPARCVHQGGDVEIGRRADRGQRHGPRRQPRGQGIGIVGGAGDDAFDAAVARGTHQAHRDLAQAIGNEEAADHGQMLRGQTPILGRRHCTRAAAD